MDRKPNIFVKSLQNSKERRLELLQTGRLSDCEFVVAIMPELIDTPSAETTSDADAPPTHQNFRCHKMILATASEVFERMFYGDFSIRDDGVVPVEDARASTFGKFLCYIYTYEMDEQLTLREISELLYLGDKYMMQDLIDALVHKLKEKSGNWWQDNVLKIFDLACLYENLPLLLYCYEKIHQNAASVISSVRFYKMDVNNLKRLVVLLSANPQISPMTLFRQLEDYGRQNNLCEQQDSESFFKLIDAVCHLDLNRLTALEFEEGPANSYLFKKKTNILPKEGKE